jgi:hypothetical protein
MRLDKAEAQLAAMREVVEAAKTWQHHAPVKHSDDCPCSACGLQEAIKRWEEGR